MKIVGVGFTLMMYEYVLEGTFGRTRAGFLALGVESRACCNATMGLLAMKN